MYATKKNQTDQPTKPQKTKMKKKKIHPEHNHLPPQQLARGRRVKFQDTQC